MAKEVAKQKQEQPAPPSVLQPPVDVYEDESGITLYADLPGASKNTLSLNIDGSVLSVEAEAELRLPEEINATYAEVRSPRYRRSFTLSQELDTDKVDAELHDGVLMYLFPSTRRLSPVKSKSKLADETKTKGVGIGQGRPIGSFNLE